MVQPPSTYPMRGIIYFFSNWILIRRIIGVLLLTMMVTLIITGLTFGFLLSLQAHALINANCPIWLSWIVATIFCILEIVLMTIIFYLIMTPFWQDSLFDDVLRLRGLEPILNKSRTRVSETRMFFRGISSGILLVILQVYVLILFQIITLIITLPLHAFPLIGTFMYCYLNAWIMTWSQLIHYHLEIKELSINESRKLAWKNREDYILFGIVAVALELIPMANFIFFWTNVVGAALWTSDIIIEERRAGLNRSVEFTRSIVEEEESYQQY